MRSDNALEFLKGSIGPFMQSLGIEHQTSCVDRPQIIGRVERKHRNILEIARALRMHASLPVSYWGDCVITATYLINRFPTAVLKFKTPFEVLLGTAPVYDHLRVFGCLAIASNTSRVADKFEARGVPCVFLGYPQHQKGYKLLNLLTHSRFVSRDVVFYEHIFPYSKASMSQVLKHIPTPLSSHMWYGDFVSTTQPVSQQHVPESNINVESQDTVHNEPVTEEIPEPPPIPNNPIQPEPVRRSSRVLVPPTWLKDFVTPHQPRANQVSVTPLQSQF